ncbi:unnamed protein product [Callosobruchus maculatus]|uniref:WH2 domain-containing protein n=1 Tax=Callosobruchus maculatus TaxID=64391 RepID=A0A653DLX0_CALMS|nr:unnamed protein product [Callosobruchus maculatus]
MLQITEDTPPDMLAGAMDLTVHLPSGHPVRMSVERSTPMMDLLVQITAKHQLQLSGYTLQALSMAPWSDDYDKVLPYKPNTPIGTLDTQHVKVVAKSRSNTLYKKSSPGHQPFESTFRLKVFLPRNQLFVTRVHTDVLLEQIMRKVCEEKCLDPRKYEFRHPANLDEALDPKLTLSDYQITEIYLVTKGVTNFSQVAAAANVTVMRKEEETKQMHNKTGGGVFNLIFRRGKAKNGTLKKENTMQAEPSEQFPKVPQRKRRPAPKPPSTSPGSSSIQENQRDEETAAGSGISETDSQVRKTDTSLLICHSRNSSDSSGYHEASVLSENNASLPRRPKSALVARETEGLSKMYSQSVTNLTKISSKPSISLGVPARKKKPAPPPPPLRASSTALSTLSTETPISVTSSQQVDNADESLSSQQQYDSIVSCHAAIAVTKNEHSNCFGSTDSGIAQETLERSTESDPSYTVPVVPATSSVPVVTTEILSSNIGDSNACPEPSAKLETTEPSNDQDTIDWQYQLPSPPKPFKDTESLAETLLSKEVGVPYSELYEKLKHVEEVQAESTAVTSQTDSTTDDTSVNGKSSTLTSTTGSTIDDSSELQIKNNAIYEKASLTGRSSQSSVTKSSANSTSDVSEYRKSSVVSSRSNSTLDNLSEILEIPDHHRLETSKIRSNMVSPKHNQTQSFSSTTDNSEGRKKSVSPTHTLDQSDNSKHSSTTDTPERRKHSASPTHNIEQSNSSKRSSIIDVTDARNSVSPPIRSQSQVYSNRDSISDIREGRETVESPIDNLEQSDSSIIGDTDGSRRSTLWSIQNNTSGSSKRSSIGDISGSTINKFLPDGLLKNRSNDDDTNRIKKLTTTEPPSSYLNGTIRDTMAEVKTNGITTVEHMSNSNDMNNVQKRRSSASSNVHQQNTNMSTSTITVCNAAPNSSPSMKNEENISSPATYTKLQNSSPSPPKQNKTPSPPPVKFIQRRVPVNTLPNFKISTYNEPKQNITVFEDDTIRSNANKPSSMYKAPNLSKKFFGGSFHDLHSAVENNHVEEPSMNFNSLNAVSRSESFSSDNVRLRSKPVSRSKSHLNLNPNRWKRLDDPFEEEMYKSNSLYDVSGLQSLEVMRLIQNKLTTSTSSLEKIEAQKPSRIDRSNTFTERHMLNSDSSTKENGTLTNPVRYSYQTQPSLKMGTWTDRPKVTINSRPTEDYKVKPRPHSMAFSQDYDTSRVPVVRSVELKKHFKASNPLHAEGEASINLKEPVLDLGSNDSGLNVNRMYNRSDKEPTNFVSRVNIFRTPAPIVRGFKNNSNTFEFKERKVFPSNRNSLPIADSKVQTGNRYNTYLNGVHRNGDIPEIKSPPPPPSMPKDIPRVQKPVQYVDTREQLLEEIRNFGGKKGFRTAQL